MASHETWSRGTPRGTSPLNASFSFSFPASSRYANAGFRYTFSKSRFHRSTKLPLLLRARRLIYIYICIHAPYDRILPVKLRSLFEERKRRRERRALLVCTLRVYNGRRAKKYEARLEIRRSVRLTKGQKFEIRWRVCWQSAEISNE